MPNPSGPYPGRQLFLGLTEDNRPCLAYLVTGRSPESRQRKAFQADNIIRIGPLGGTSYDPLRHYAAVKFDNASGVAAVSNGIQTEAIYEAYRLLFNVGSLINPDQMAKLLEGADAEPDNLHTPRIGGIVVPGKGNPVFIIGIKSFDIPATANQIVAKPGTITSIATYQGDMAKPQSTDPAARLPELPFFGKSAADLARSAYDISAATYNGDDIRVCAVAGIYKFATWEIAVINKY